MIVARLPRREVHHLRNVSIVSQVEDHDNHIFP
jgi:hypothetical protein